MARTFRKRAAISSVAAESRVSSTALIGIGRLAVTTGLCAL